jgi:hypothetical protein
VIRWQKSGSFSKNIDRELGKWERGEWNLKILVQAWMK